MSTNALVKQLNDKWNAAFNRGDAAGVADLYAEDAVLSPGNGETLKGRDAIQGLFQSFIDNGVHDHDIDIIEAHQSGDVLYEVVRSFSIIMALLAVLLMPLHAQAKTNILFILDGSNSMWGQIEGEAKITSAQRVLSGLLNDLPDDTQIGFMVYGHREEGSCEDIEIISNIGEAKPSALSEKINALKPKGKTPIAGALSKSLDVLGKKEGDSNNVVLISDGVESCDGDPCAAAKALADAGINARVHVVGFDVGKKEREQLACISELGGGKYYAAANAEELKQAFSEVKEEALAETESAAGPQTEIWLEDSFDGDDLAEHWELSNPDPDSYIVEDNKLLLIASKEGGLSNAELPNIIKLAKDLPDVDWTVTVKFTGAFQTGVEDFWLGLYDDNENYIAGQMWTKADKFYGHGLIQNMHKMTKGELTTDKGAIHFKMGCNVCGEDRQFNDFVQTIVQPIYMRLRKQGRSYLFDMRFAGEVNEDGSVKWRDAQTLTSLRAPKTLVMAVSQYKKTDSETLFKVDNVKIEIPKE